MELRLDRYIAGRLKCFMNGVSIDTLVPGNAATPRAWSAWAPRPVESLRPGRVFDRWMFEADVTPLVKTGENEWVMELASGLLDENRGCEAPLLFGDFVIAGARETERLAAVDSRPVSGDWRMFGYPYYAGMAAYRKHVQCPPCPGAKRWVLSLGDLANAAEVLVNGQSAGRKILPPWEFELTAFAGMADLDIEVRIINTPKNLWDPDTRPSGLFGPVELRAYS
jgi:hypothetical protein